jgi:hypothetical protein
MCSVLCELGFVYLYEPPAEYLRQPEGKPQYLNDLRKRYDYKELEL